MPTNEQRRVAAKRKLERQLERKAQRTKRRKKIWIGSGVIVVVIALVVVGIVLWNRHKDAVAAEQAAEYRAHTCAYTSAPLDPAPKGKDVGLPPNPYPTPRTGLVKATMVTSQGDIPLVLDRAQAPCTVQNIVHLITKKFYDNTRCHRLTSTDMLKVLVCGDPAGQGHGGPGYTIPDEKPTGLKNAPSAIEQQAAQTGTTVSTYPRGTIAMANTGQPNSGGSQFFFVYGDSYLPPNYTVFGTVDAAGLSTLDKIVKNGIFPGQSQDPVTGQPVTDPKDGQPKIPVTVISAMITG